jgi:23S rRNA pseudouridine2605 synthase
VTAATVPLIRLLSKRRIASRSEAAGLLASGHVRVDGRVVTDALIRVRASAEIVVEGREAYDDPLRVVALNKPRGTITTRRDPEGRPTVFDVLGASARGLVAVGRLDRASTGLLLFTTDTSLAAALTDPANRILRRYLVTVRGRVDDAEATRLENGVDVAGERGRVERLAAARIIIRKASGRETHLIVDLDEGRNREIRRLFAASGHEVTRLHRVAFGAIEIGSLGPGAWREVEAGEVTATLGRAFGASARRPATTRTPHPPRAKTGGSDWAASGASVRGRSRSR